MEDAKLEHIKPGWGYWVLANDCTELKIGGSLFSPVTTPSSKKLVKGWNLIGYYGTDWQDYDEDPLCGGWWRGFNSPVYCALSSLVDTQQGYPRWSSLWTYINCKCEDDKPCRCYCEREYGTDECWVGLNACVTPGAKDRMYAGKGYWIEIDVDDLYAPASTCIWDKDFKCIKPGGR